MRVLFIALIFIGCFYLQLAGQSKNSDPRQADSLISAGNKSYMNHDYAGAVLFYEQVIAKGYVSGDLFYNLGNAFFRQNQLGKAILFYEKALLYKPGDEDILANLALTSTRITDKIESIPEFFVHRWLAFMTGILSPDQWALLGYACFFVALACFLFLFITPHFGLRRLFGVAGSVLILLFLWSILAMNGRIRKIRQSRYAIIMTESVNARNSPDEQSTHIFVLHEGTKVMVLDSVLHWKEIKIADGNKGWVPAEVLEGI
jgi:tetratricopeptide (TPR) repeat protein